MMNARDFLRAKLGYSESLATAIAQMPIDEEIEVRLQPDGQYAFSIKQECEVDDLEVGLYASG
jgi:hypothetical protein